MVEVMVAMVVSLILTAGVINIFLGSQQTYRFNDELSRIQENGRFAMETLSRSVRMAGYTGCGRMTNIAPNIIVDPPSAVDFNVDRILGGENDVGDGTSVGGRAVREGTDTLIVRGGTGGVGRVLEQSVSNANIKLESNVGGWQANDILIVSDCSTIDIFRATNVSQSDGTSNVTIAHGSNGNVTNRLSKVYTEGASLVGFRETTYFVSDGASGIPSLWRRVGNTSEELVEGVENFQVLFGVDTNGNESIDTFLTASQVSSQNRWEGVVSVRLSLLLVSGQDNIVDEVRPHVFNGQSITADDRRLRQVVSTTIGVRNKLP